MQCVAEIAKKKANRLTFFFKRFKVILSHPYLMSRHSTLPCIVILQILPDLLKTLVDLHASMIFIIPGKDAFTALNV